MSCGSLCSADHVGAEFIPIFTIDADEFGDFAESLVPYDVWEGHGSGMGCFWLDVVAEGIFLLDVG